MRKTHREKISPATGDCSTRGCNQNQDSFRAVNITDLFTKSLMAKVFKGYLECLSLRDMYIR